MISKETLEKSIPEEFSKLFDKYTETLKVIFCLMHTEGLRIYQSMFFECMENKDFSLLLSEDFLP